MSIKLQRSYILNAQLNNGDDIQVEYPLTLEFSITRRAWSSTNNCIFRVRNLRPESRNRILRDAMDYTDIRYLKLSAGYGNPPWPLIFNGNVRQAYSFKDSGSPNFITEWQGWDFGYPISTAFSNVALAPAASKQQVVNQLVTDMVSAPGSLPNTSGSSANKTSGLNIGYVSQFTGSYPRGRTLFGPTWQILQQETNGACFIDNGFLHVLQPFDVFGGATLLIDAETGLLSPPRRTESYLEIELMFEPNIQCGQQVNLVSETLPNYNGTYQVKGLEHRGIISGSVNGRATTKLLLFYQVKSFNQIPQQGLPQLEGVLG